MIWNVTLSKDVQLRYSWDGWEFYWKNVRLRSYKMEKYVFNWKIVNTCVLLNIILRKPCKPKDLDNINKFLDSELEYLKENQDARNVFSMLYKDTDDDVKNRMNKSMQGSGRKMLSRNTDYIKVFANSSVGAENWAFQPKPCPQYRNIGGYIWCYATNIRRGMPWDGATWAQGIRWR